MGLLVTAFQDTIPLIKINAHVIFYIILQNVIFLAQLVWIIQQNALHVILPQHLGWIKALVSINALVFQDFMTMDQSHAKVFIIFNIRMLL